MWPIEGGVFITKKFDLDEWKKGTQEKMELTKFDGIVPGQNIDLSEEMMAESSSLLNSIEDKRYLILSGISSFLAVATLFLLLVQGDSNDDIYAPIFSLFDVVISLPFHQCHCSHCQAWSRILQSLFPMFFQFSANYIMGIYQPKSQWMYQFWFSRFSVAS